MRAALARLNLTKYRLRSIAIKIAPLALLHRGRKHWQTPPRRNKPRRTLLRLHRHAKNHLPRLDAGDN
jgi:hypothetical protein